jgi:antibiotic biosynthesis monooxygenase (ABM) superfamily enzyme
MKTSTFVTLLMLVIFAIFIGPVFTIMALNTLFDTQIDLTFGTWFAMAWLHILLASSLAKKG